MHMKRKMDADLLEWKNSPKRMPLILNGARQVGKTYSLREFGKREYTDCVYANLETNPALAELFTSGLEPTRIINFLQTFTDQKIVPGKTLIILDEIQTCERALTSLKYFRERAPEYHIATAGSLLGVAINRERFSFPVGNVRTMTMHPLDFEEFMWTQGMEELGSLIRSHYETDEAMPLALHERALELYRSYLIVGGMPACVQTFVDTGAYLEAPLAQNQILNDYIADMAKYATNTESVKIRAAFNSIPSQLAKENRKFQYKTVRKGGTAAIFGASIEWLNFAGIVLKCRKTEQGRTPIAVYEDNSSFKLYMGDVGLLTMKSGLAPQTILSPLEIDNTFLGALAENYVAAAFAAKGYPLFYWESKGVAEVDFVLQKGPAVIPVEVKAGVHTRSKSLNQFIQLYQPPYGIRLSGKNFGFGDKVKSVPLYAAFCV